jgi:non-heme chloroperoxidase
MRQKWNYVAIAMLFANLLLIEASPQSGRTIEDGVFTTSDGTHIHFLHEGKQGRLPSLVFIPGWTLSARLWTEQLKHFSEDRLVVAVDPRSQAESAQSLVNNTPEGRARDLQELVVHLGIRNFVIVGWSQGAQDVAAYVTQFGTGQLAGLVFVDSPISAGPEEITLHPEFSKAILAGLGVYANHPTEYCAGLVHSIFAKPHPQLDISTLVAESRKTPSPVGTQMLIMDMFGVDRRPAVKQIDKPTLVIASSTSPLLQAQKDMASAIPSARFVTVEGAGHALFVDDPEEFEKALLELLAR